MFRTKIFLALFFNYFLLGGQSIWTPIQPDEYPSYHLDTSALYAALAHHHTIDLPLPGLKNEPILMEERSNFSEILAAKYPKIKSYHSSLSSPRIYLDVYEHQVHIFYRTTTETYFIEPLDNNSTNRYKVVLASSLNVHSKNTKSFSCKTLEPTADQMIEISAGFRNTHADKINLKTYRLALAITAEFAATLGNTKEKILAGLNSHLTRINAVYINENAIQFKLVPNNDTLLFMDSNQPYTNGRVDKMISENVAVLNARIGLNNYDIGHVFGTNDGGLAQISTVCTANKAAAGSCAFGVYTDLLFYTIPCHEMGHQLSATHIFNFCDNSNETSSSAFEPGSGSTIMSYAGASNCGKNYVQDIQDPYFNAFSLQQIRTYSRTGIGNLCGTSTLVDNEPPQLTITSPTNVIIPILTPFELEGIGIDDKSLSLDYTWEQMDLGQISPLGSPMGNAPLFRSIPPNPSPTRVFPAAAFILSNTSRLSEVLPTISRPLNFRYSARDNDVVGGGVTWTDISFRSTALAGPFKITSLNDSAILFIRDAQYITWDVAKTFSAPVNCKSVDILWSADGGLSYTALVKSTPNDGSEWITLPSQQTSTGRIKIKAVGNIFFDVNDTYIRLSNALNPKIKIYTNPDQLNLCAGSGSRQIIKSSVSASQDSIRLISNIIQDENISIVFSKKILSKDDSAFMTIIIKPNAKPEDRILIVNGINLRTGDSTSIHIKLRITSDQVKLTQPENNQDQVSTMPLFQWGSIPYAEEYQLEISESPNFQSAIWTKRLLSGDTTAIPDTALKANQIYFWRIRATNDCGVTNSNFAVFHTQSLICKTYIPNNLPKFISATGTPRIISDLTIPDSINLQLITVPILRGTHDFIADLTVRLQSPMGDSINLWNKQCNNLSNFNLGFDDQAPLLITCPLTDRKLHKPQQAFSNLLTSTSKGIWKLIIQDENSGAGGSLDEWSLQLCGAIRAKGPQLKTNNVIEVIELQTKSITKDLLEAIDADSEPNNLKYILLQNPQKGNLILKGIAQKTGATFTQGDINAGSLSFKSFNVSTDTMEEISLLVVDESNNWSGIQKIKLKIINDLTIATTHTNLFRTILAYPNPFHNQLTIENRSRRAILLSIYTTQGVRIQSFVAGPYSLKNTPLQLPQGIYYLKYSDEKNAFVIQKIISN